MTLRLTLALALAAGCHPKADVAPVPSSTCLDVVALQEPELRPTPTEGAVALGEGRFAWTGESDGDSGSVVYVGVAGPGGTSRLWDMGREGMFDGLTLTGPLGGSGRPGGPVWLETRTSWNTRPSSYHGSQGGSDASFVLWDPVGARLLARFPLRVETWAASPWWCDEEPPPCPSDDPEVNCDECRRDAQAVELATAATVHPSGAITYGGSPECPAGTWRWWKGEWIEWRSAR
jgi:hypothetical protein